MLSGLLEGFRTLARSWGLTVLVMVVNLSLAAALAVPLVGVLEREMQDTDTASTMLYGFDYGWWSRFSEGRSGWTASFRPDVFGVGFAFKNLDLLLKGELPARLFARGHAEPELEASDDDERRSGLDGVILALGALYLLVQTFLVGGILGVLRAPQGHWTVRGLLHGSGFYFGRLARVAAIGLLGAYALFLLNAPVARLVDGVAREAVSEATAIAWLLGRHAALLLALLMLAMVSSYAKVIVVLEERSSALLAWVSALGFCLRNPLRTAGHYLAIALLWVGLLAAWAALDSRWQPTGYRTQMVTLLLGQGLVFWRIWLRLALLGGQVAIHRASASGPR